MTLVAMYAKNKKTHKNVLKCLFMDLTGGHTSNLHYGASEILRE
jgi:hypothetical protein